MVLVLSSVSCCSESYWGVWRTRGQRISFRTTPFRHSHLNHQSRSVRIHIARFTLFSRLGHHSARHVFTRLRSHFFFSFFQGSHGPLHVRFTFFSRLSWPVSILYKALMARFTFFQGSHGPYHSFFSRFSWPVFFLEDSQNTKTVAPR